jgi:superfamily II DNA or RNA helicase
MLSHFNGHRIVRNPKKVPHYYQKDAVEAVHEHEFIEGWDTSLVVIPTGGGKSFVTGELCAQEIEKGGRSLFLAHAKELVTQPRAAFEDDFGCPATIEMASMKADDSPMVFASVQTMANRIKSGKWRPDTFQRIICDESHRSLAEGHKMVMEHFGKEGTPIVGCTATPRRGDKKDLLKFFDGIAYDKPIQDLFREGFLIEPTIQLVPLGIIVKQDKPSDMTDEEVGEAIEPYLDEAADHVARIARGRCGLSFLPLRKTARSFRDRLIERGLRVEYVGGDIEKEEQGRIKQALERGDIDHVCNAQIWGEGVDIRPVNLIVDLRPTCSWTAAMQKWGRGTRTFDPSAPYASHLRGVCRWGKKSDCVIMDFCFETERHSMIQRPAVMVAKDDEEAKAITEILSKGGGGNLMEAVKTAANDRESALKKRLEAMRSRKALEISAMEFFMGQGRMDLVDYEPQNKWELEPPTEKQIEMLAKNRFDLESIQGKGHAAKVIDVLMDRVNKKLCTINQARFIESLMKENPSFTIPVASPYEMGFDLAKRWLDLHSPRKPHWKK